MSKFRKESVENLQLALDKMPKKLKDSIYFVIPAFNEGRAIGDVISILNNNNFFKLVIVDDGSSDNTSQVVLDLKTKKGLVLLKHAINRGQGASLKTGIDYALNEDECKYIVTFDSDGQHRITDLPKFISVLERGLCDIAIGSRFLKKESRRLVPMKKRILLKGALLITLFLSNIKLTDTHNGYRVMNKKAARKIDINMDGFEHASEILDEIAKKRVRYVEVPTFIDYTEYSKQKGQKISNSIKIFMKMIFRNS
ncbi:MAG: glycosyltransferase family 2 protein [Nanoarchaeota archaeon]|nr:glycosyltransferase family 2 protein [Nanoarchaeota archaeon]